MYNITLMQDIVSVNHPHDAARVRLGYDLEMPFIPVPDTWINIGGRRYKIARIEYLAEPVAVVAMTRRNDFDHASGSLSEMTMGEVLAFLNYLEIQIEGLGWFIVEPGILPEFHKRLEILEQELAYAESILEEE